LLGQGEQDFWKLFLPLLAGTMTGSFLPARLADRVSRRVLLGTAIPLAVVAGAGHVIIVAIAPSLPWAVIAPVLLACAIGTAFPVLNLEILDLLPDHRGAPAPVRPCASRICNAP